MNNEDETPLSIGGRCDSIFRDESVDDGFDDEDNYSEESVEEDFEISVSELLYSSSSYYAIAKPVSLTMILAALAVVYVNTDETIENGEEAMASAYQVWKTSDDSSSGGVVATLALSLANSFVMVSVICAMTFVIVLLYRLRLMKCLIGYMIFSSSMLLGILGGNLLHTAVLIYAIPIDQLSFYVFVLNFGIVGVLSIFWGQGIPTTVTQGYLVATSVILAWHLSYFDEWTTWSLLFMLALYDLCAVLTPCGPLKFLVELMSKEDSPDMPGLLFEAELPPEAHRPGVPKKARQQQQRPPPSSESTTSGGSGAATKTDEASDLSGIMANRESNEKEEGLVVNIPLALVKVYNLPVLSIPEKSKEIMMQSLSQNKNSSTHVSSSPLLGDNEDAAAHVVVPDEPTAAQLRAEVTVRLPPNGGRIERYSKRGKRVYLEKDRNGDPKRILWVDRHGKVFAEMRGDDEDFADGDGDEKNSIRLGLGDFIFYSVLVAKAAQYSFATFAACMLVILAGLGGTLVLLSVYHHALPALPISIFLGVFFYLVTRVFIEPWIEAVLLKPFYV